ncbi:MAG: T9SS type A sorting domain-containing protein [Flavobacteriaceae bacterium]|nr:T9SS type A sorting domain-containing protein [Flavobacteriaceae bacterium]
MKTNIFLFVLLIPCLLVGQVFDVETIMENGPAEKRINMVILSDGYQEAELDQFIIDATSFSDDMFSQTPYAEYVKYFNVYAIKVPSNESGASHPGTASDVPEPVHPIIDVDNYFGSTFDVAGIHRLVVPQNGSAIVSVLAANFPMYDQVVIMANSPHYGGSGGTYATTTLDASANEIAIHEIGHSFVSLKDEYWAGDVFASEALNMTQETDPALVKWRNWLNDNGIGIYQHCCGGSSANWYRPHNSCKMRQLGPPFCSVCVEATVERIHNLLSPIDSYTPDNAGTVAINISDLPYDFELSLLDPEPLTTLDVTWDLNGNAFGGNDATVSVDIGDFVDGSNTLIATVEDVTDLLRVDNHSSIHQYMVQWDIEYDPILGITDIEADEFTLQLDISPNPVSDEVEILLDSEHPATYEIYITSLNGQLLSRQKITPKESLVVDMSNWAAGVYIMNLIREGGVQVSSKKLIKE